MSYRLRTLTFILTALLAPLTAGVAGAAPVANNPPAADVRPVDWLVSADEAARPVTVAAVPLPPAAAGSLACVAVVIALRCSRHRRWVTLR